MGLSVRLGHVPAIVVYCERYGIRAVHSIIGWFPIHSNGNNLMMYASKLKVDRGIPGEPILYLLGKYRMY